MDPGPPASPKSHSATRVILEWAAIVAVAVLAAFLIRAFVVQPFSIPSGSMEPTLKDHDRLLVNKLSYHFHNVHRGDVVVFKKPRRRHHPGHHRPGKARSSASLAKRSPLATVRCTSTAGIYPNPGSRKSTKG